jgi:hypothetical protein
MIYILNCQYIMPPGNWYIYLVPESETARGSPSEMVRGSVSERIKSSLSERVRDSWREYSSWKFYTVSWRDFVTAVNKVINEEFCTVSW